MASDVIQFPSLAMTQTAKLLGGSNLLDSDIKMSDLYSSVQKSPGGGDFPEVIALPELNCVPQTVATEISQGWSNQELADLYRTHRLLALAGINTEVDRGITDEGDPWFVFMDSQNEVFVHFSRLDGFYMVTSQVQDKPVRGDSLADLVSEFSKSVQPTAETDNDRSNVVSIIGRSQSSVLIHPAAALAALVWSIYLMSGELVAAAPLVASDFAGEDVPPQAGVPYTEADIDVLPELVQKAMAVLTDPTLAKQVADPYQNREVSLGTQAIILPSGLSMKAVGLGLSLAALSVGLPLIDTNLKAASSEVKDPLLSIKELYTLVSHLKEAVVEVDMFQGDRAEMVDGSENLMPLAHADTQIKVYETSIEFSEIIQAIPTSFEADAAAVLALQQNITTREAVTTAEVQVSVSSDAFISDKEVAKPSDIGLLQRFDIVFENFALSNIETLAQPKFAELMAFNTTVSEFLTPPENPLQPNQYVAFDDEARVFLDFLIRTYDDIKVVTMPTEIIFIHVGALDMANIDHPIYAKSWSFDDGGVISTIGLKSDLELFDLIA